MFVYVSDHGKVYCGEVLKETPKGFKIKSDRYSPGRFYTHLVFRDCPHGSHKTFKSKQESIGDARKWLRNQEVKAEVIMDMVQSKRKALLSI